MSPDREITTNELAEDVRALTAELREFRHWADRTFVRQDVYGEHRKADEKASDASDARVLAVENRQTWIARTAVTALVLPALVAVMVALILGAVR